MNSGNYELSIDFQKGLRWITLAVLLLTTITQVILQPFWNTFQPANHIWISNGLIILLGIWTFVAPSARWPSSIRFLALAIEVMLVFVASMLGAPRLFYFVYMCFVAKAAWQLEIKGLIAMMLAIFAAHAIGAAIKSDNFYHLAAANAFTLPKRYPLFVHMEVQLYFIFCMIVVAAMARTMIAERKTRLLAEQLSEEIEDLAVRYERARISRDIHDALGHRLTSLSIQLDVAETMYDKNQTTARQALAAAKDLAANSLADVRHSVHMIREQDGSPFDLQEAVVGLVNRARRNHEIAIDLSIDAPVLPLIKAHNLFCVIQESLTNAQRHAHAKKIQIELKQETNNILLHIKDDGAGFDLGACEQGLGIKSMQERVESLGGTIEIATAPNSGTEVQVCVPMSLPKAS
jgi:signal transduction histidine kinase